MRNLPPEPSSGDKVTADFARELIRAIKERQLLDGPDYALASSPNGTVLKLKHPNNKQNPARLRPWEIHFFPAQTQEDEDFWGAYLPAGSLNVAGEEVTPTDESGTALAAAGTAYLGYYVIPVASGTSPSAFWLHVYKTSEYNGISYRATVGTSATANAGSGEETLTSIRLCSIASSGAITQLIVGAITLGGGGDSGGGGSGGGAYPTIGTPKTMVTGVSMMPTSSSATGYVSSYAGYVRVDKGELQIDAAGVINIKSINPEYLETAKLSDLVVSNALKPHT